jgi:hypothetical protein
MFCIPVFQFFDAGAENPVQKVLQNLFAANASENDLEAFVQGQVCITVQLSVDDLKADSINFHQPAFRGIY